ncbi:MAG: TonB-dependent receptor [bacterium]|nr:TonB-dependent receptor [bacterium]
MKKTVSTFVLAFSIAQLSAQTLPDSTKDLEEVTITFYKAMNGIGRMKDDDGQVIYAGKKTEVLLIDALDANKAINNTRQIIGRIPGLNIVESESGGFTANGIAFRGLNPYQSTETNTRQNGYNISADIFGYNEAYYLPPMEAVKAIVFVRGASALAFGPQIGGMIDYQLKEAPAKPFELSTSQSVGSYGLFNSFTSVGGSAKKIKYYGFLNYRFLDGWRENSQQKQWSGFASVKYNPTQRLQFGIEYTGLRNTIQMPGGLTDSLFNADPQQSLRSRNWLQSPWNVLSANASYTLNQNSSLSFKSTYLHSQRDIVWRNEDGGPAAPDTITASYSYVPREVEHEYFRNLTNELRYLTKYELGSQKQTFSMGARYVYSALFRQHGAEGTTGSDLDYTTTSAWGGEMKFHTINFAGFAENIFRLGQKFSITPGLRYEYIESIADGYDENEDADAVDPYVYSHQKKNRRTFLLGGIGMQYKFTESVNAYANYSQSYKPITYSELTPFGTIAKIDPNLKDGSADNIDLGFRGSVKNILNFDISAFYLHYKNRVGTIYYTDTITHAFRTNTGNSEHKGLETYLEMNLLDGLISGNRFGKLSIYNSYAIISARYVQGEYTGNQVEYAPKQIERVGINYKYKALSFNVQYSSTSSCFSDAGNAKFADDALSGLIPSYKLIDVSGCYKFRQKFQVKFGVNNVMNKKYFTFRTTEYPGPGIIPSIGRMIYLGISATI